MKGTECERALRNLKLQNVKSVNCFWLKHSLRRTLGDPWDSLGKNTGVGYHSLLQGLFPTPVIKAGSLALQVDSTD